jgi:hypothetical protein
MPRMDADGKGCNDMRIETLAALLGTDALPGSPEELAILAIRIEELMRRNGQAWVIRNRHRLIEEWTFIVDQGVIRRP